MTIDEFNKCGRDAVIEECAKAARKWAQADPEYRDCWKYDSVYAAIMALKEDHL